MTWKEICDQVIAIRFKEPERDQVEFWVRAAYAKTWAYAHWPFRYRSPQDLTITAGTSQVDMPDEAARLLPDGIRDANGNPLRYLPPQTFWNYYQDTADTGTPVDYTLNNRLIFLGPIPSTSTTFSVAYERKVSYRSAADAATGHDQTTFGQLGETGDDDQPLWVRPHHFLLVPGAMSIGLKLQNDPTWPPLEQEFQESLEAMANYYIPPDAPSTSQYGADNLGYELTYWG